MFLHFLFSLFLKISSIDPPFIDNSTLHSLNSTLSEDVFRLRDSVPLSLFSSPPLYPQASPKKRQYLLELNRLYTDVMKNYEKDLSPAYSKYDDEDAPPPMVVMLTAESVILLTVNENEQILTIIMDLVMDWEDERLLWDAESYSGIRSLYIRRKELWMPDVAPYECQSVDELRPEETRIVEVSSEGRAQYRFTLVLGCICNLELEDYPFDTQLCSTQFYVYQHHIKTMVVRGQASKNITLTEGNDVWEINNVNTTEDPKMYNSPLSGPTEMNLVEFNYEITRNYLFYIVFIVFPTSLLSIISLIAMFHEKIDKFNKLGKIAIGIGVLTAMTLILTIVAESVPRKKNISILATFIIANIFVIAVATFAVVVNPSRIVTRGLRRMFPREQTKPLSIILAHGQPQRSTSTSLSIRCMSILISIISSNLLLLLIFEAASLSLLAYIIQACLNPV